MSAAEPQLPSARCRLAAGKRRARGAALVEALIVISMLTLGLMGLIFFKNLYVKQIRAWNLARSSVLAYSMTGCEPQQPKDWIGRKDLASLTAKNPDSASQSATGKEQNQSATPPDEGKGVSTGVLDNVGLSGDGKGVMNPIVSTDLSGKVTLDTKPGVLAQRKTVFTSGVHARSWVSCGDTIREGNVKEVLSTVKGQVTKLMRL